MSDELLKKLVNEYYASRPNLAVHHAPLCVFFFACSGAGKSTVRRLLVNELQATYVCNDEVRALLAKYPEAAMQGIELKTIVAETVERIFAEASNKLIIFDNNIIQYYMHDDSYLNVARVQRRPIFIIGLEVSEDDLAQRIKNRGENTSHILDELPAQIQAYKNAIHDIQPDWVLKNATNSSELQKLLKTVAQVAL